MYRGEKLVGLTVLVICVTVLSACMTQIIRLEDQPPMALELAIRSLTHNLMIQMKDDMGLEGMLPVRENTLVIIDPFVDTYNNEIPRSSRKIENIMIVETAENFKSIDLDRITSVNLPKADYVMNGTIRLESYQPPETAKVEACYRVSASVVNLGTNIIVAHSEVRISDKDLDYRPIPIQEDSPMYPQDKILKSSAAIASGSVGMQADKNYYESLEAISILTEAETAYENADYEAALNLLQQAAARPDGQMMKTYAGLYSTYRKLERMEMAEDAFAKLLSVSVEKNKLMTVKFLFAVNAVDFWKDPDLKSQYQMWLRQIGRYFAKSPDCLRIVGHCSKTGTEKYNDKLSLERAIRIQELMKSEFPDIIARSKAEGRGFRETIKGIGTDDERDAVDRRVEFFVKECDPSDAVEKPKR
jgi:outer membrane protein OmpA-like peptidoglycan-associated protein